MSALKLWKRTNQRSSNCDSGVSIETPYENQLVVNTREDDHGTVTYLEKIGLLQNNLLALILFGSMILRNPSGILISPGPGTPQDSGISLQVVLELGPSIPLFGVYMGLQCIGEAFGGKIVRSPFGVMHGKSSAVYYDEKGEDGLFSGLLKSICAQGLSRDDGDATHKKSDLQCDFEDDGLRVWLWLILYSSGTQLRFFSVLSCVLFGALYCNWNLRCGVGQVSWLQMFSQRVCWSSHFPEYDA